MGCCVFPIFIPYLASLKKAYIAVTNDLATDQRVGRVAAMLTNKGFDVTCIGRKFRNSPVPDLGTAGIRRFSMLVNRGPLFYAFFNTRLFMMLLFCRKPLLFIANDLDTLPAAFLASRIRRIVLIYDSHEFFTQVPELVNRKRVQQVWKGLESLIVPRLSYGVTVSYPIAEIYRRLYGTRFRVVRNTPPYREPPVKHQPADGKEHMVIYQGSLNVGRGLELMIKAMEFLDDVVFVVAGTGDIERELHSLAEGMGLENKVKFQGRVPPDQLNELTCRADLGISLEEDLGLNYRYALPNKLFDYIQCRIPVLCSALPEMSKIVETYGIGIVVRQREPERIARSIRFMLEESGTGAWAEALNRAASELNWERESKEYLRVLEDSGVIEREI